MKRYLILAIIAIFHSVIAEQIDPAIPCEKNQTCTSYSQILKDPFCKDGFCVCKNGTEFKNCSSLAIMHLNSRNTRPLVFRPCKIDQDCKEALEFCNTTISQCECKKGYVLSSTKQQCLKKAEAIDFPCVDEKQCIAFLPNTTCRSGQCTCVPGYHYAEKACYRTVDFESPCVQSEECFHIEGAICNENNTCGCPAETVISTDKEKCLLVAREFSEECIEDVQCNTTFSDSLCIDNKCQCRHQYHFESDINRCFINKGLNEECAHSYECYQVGNESENVSVKSLECLHNKCVCAENYYRNDDMCVNGASYFVGSALPFFLALLVYGSSSWRI